MYLSQLAYGLTWVLRKYSFLFWASCKYGNVRLTFLAELFIFRVISSDPILKTWKYDSRRHVWAENITLFNLHDLGNLLTKAMKEIIWRVICSPDTEKSSFPAKTLLWEFCWMSEIIWTLAHELSLTLYTNILGF